MARPSSLPPAPPALALPAGEVPAQILATHAPTHALRPRPEQRDVNVEAAHRRGGEEAEGLAGMVPLESTDIPDLKLDPRQALEASEALVHLRTRLRQISSQDLQILTWRFADQLPLRSIAARLGTTGKAAERRLARAAEKVRRLCRDLQEGRGRASERIPRF